MQWFVVAASVGSLIVSSAVLCFVWFTERGCDMRDNQPKVVLPQPSVSFPSGDGMRDDVCGSRGSARSDESVTWTFDARPILIAVAAVVSGICIVLIVWVLQSSARRHMRSLVAGGSSK